MPKIKLKEAIVKPLEKQDRYDWLCDDDDPEYGAHMEKFYYHNQVKKIVLFANQGKVYNGDCIIFKPYGESVIVANYFMKYIEMNGRVALFSFSCETPSELTEDLKSKFNALCKALGIRREQAGFYTREIKKRGKK